MSPGTIIIGLGVVFALAATLGVAYGVARASARTSRIEWAAREVDMLSRSNQRLESEVTRLQGKVDTLSQANAVLQETVSGAAAVRVLAEDIAREERARREEHQAQLTILKDLIAEIRRRRGNGEGELGAIGR